MPRISSAGAVVSSPFGTSATWASVTNSTLPESAERADPLGTTRSNGCAWLRELAYEPDGAALGAGGSVIWPQLVGHVVSVPAFMAAIAASILDGMSGVIRAALVPCAGATPIPSLVASNRTSPALAVPAAIAWMASLTAVTRFLVADVTTHP